MASMPDMNKMMADMQKPTTAEKNQAAQALQSQALFMKYGVGKDKNGIIPQLSKRIDQMGSAKELSRQQGFRNVANQTQFNGGGMLRANALAGTTGSGIGESGVRRAYDAFGDAQAQGQTSTRLNAITKQQDARVGYAKMGQGFADTVNTSLGDLGQVQTQGQQAALKMAMAEQENALNSQMGYAGLGLGLAGMTTGALSGAVEKNPATGKSSFNSGKFMTGLGSGWTGR